MRRALSRIERYWSRFSAHLRLYGFVVGIVSGADVAHGFQCWSADHLVVLDHVLAQPLIMRRFRLNLFSNAD